MEKPSAFDQASGEVCPGCGEEILVGSGAGPDELEVDCSCGSVLALA